jgi:hypothetical protein
VAERRRRRRLERVVGAMVDQLAKQPFGLRPGEAELLRDVFGIYVRR